MMIQMMAAACCVAGLHAAVWAQAAEQAAMPDKPGEASPLERGVADRAAEMAKRAEAWLVSQQDKVSGGWGVPEGAMDEAGRSVRPHMPGITALVLTGLLLGADEEASGKRAARPEVMMGVKYLLNWQQADGGIYDRVLPSYNTSLAVSALSKVDMPRAREARDTAVGFLRKLQWSEFSDNSVGGGEAPKPVERNHPFYGGVGYGKHGRPDGSNMNLFMQAMQDAGVPSDDPAVQRALVFLQRLQMQDSVNDMPYADSSNQGGFIYATVENAESVDGRAGQSMAGMVEETLDDGTQVSRLRAYGSMTYAGFKSYLYAELNREDERVQAAFEWIRRHYTVDENPGMGTDGLYYYYVTFARALAALGEDRIGLVKGEGMETERRDWRTDLVAKLATLQNEDGSFRSVDDRWMENDPVLITAYALIALREATK